MIPFPTPRMAGAIGGALLIAIVVLGLLLWGEQRHSAKLQLALTTCGKTLENERQAVRDRTAAAKADDAAHAARVERDDARIAMETNDAIRKAIAAARADSVRPGAPAADPGGGGKPPVPGAADAPGGTDGAGGAAELAAADRMICAENTVKAESWQTWWAAIEAAPR